MADSDVDEDLLQLLRQSLGLSKSTSPSSQQAKVLGDAQYIYDNAIDVAIDSTQTKATASAIWQLMQAKSYSLKTWSDHELHPKTKDDSTVDFIFTMDLLNFSFWSEELAHPYAVDYRGRRWTGYWSLIAALQRALSEDIDITSPTFWTTDACSETLLEQVFRSDNDTRIPMLAERLDCLRQAGAVIQTEFESSISVLVKRAKGSAVSLVDLLATHFDVFRDESVFEGRKVHFFKRAQIFVADLWACFKGEGIGSFYDIDKITMFADYRIPQMLHSFGCLQYSPPLSHHIRQQRLLEPGHSWELQLRGCSIWAVDLIRQHILKSHPHATVNAVLIDFFLYDHVKEQIAAEVEMIPHHRTRSIWY